MTVLNKYVVAIFLLGLLFKLGDIGSTLYLVSLYGIDGEGNPWIRYLIESQGIAIGLIVSFFQASVCWIFGLWLIRDNVRHQLYFVSIFLLVHFCITVNNVMFISLVE